jgi:hypothetical protein
MSPTYVDLRPRFDGVRDQGRRPTCLAFAVTAIHEVKRAAPEHTTEDLSDEALYWGCKRTDGNTRRGTGFDSGKVALAKWGQPLEAVLPYDFAKDDSKPVRAISGAGGAAWFKEGLRPVRVGETEIKASLPRWEGTSLCLEPERRPAVVMQ